MSGLAFPCGTSWTIWKVATRWKTFSRTFPRCLASRRWSSSKRPARRGWWAGSEGSQVTLMLEGSNSRLRILRSFAVCAAQDDGGRTSWGQAFGPCFASGSLHHSCIFLRIERLAVLPSRCRRSAACHIALRFPSADALGYVDFAAPRLLRMTGESLPPGFARIHWNRFAVRHDGVTSAPGCFAGCMNVVRESR